MRGAVVLLGAGAALIAAVAVWLVFETRAPPPATETVGPTANAVVPAPPPMPMPVPTPAAPSPTQPAAEERVTAPLAVKLDEKSIAEMPRRLSGPALSKVRAAFADALAESRAAIAADRKADEVVAPINRARDRVRELLNGPEPSDTVMAAMRSFDELEREARARAAR